MKFSPCGNRVLVAPDTSVKKTTAGLLVPGSTTAYETGLVIDVGEGRVLDSGVVHPTGFEPGQRVAYIAAGSIEIAGAEQKQVLLDAQAILGRITD